MKEEKIIPVEAIPRDLNEINDITGNLYESIVIIGKRANQLAREEKEELVQKLADFAPKTDNLEEFFDNREQMEISAHYERRPKPTIVSCEEFLDGKIYFRNPAKDKEEQEPEPEAEKLEQE